MIINNVKYKGICSIDCDFAYSNLCFNKKYFKAQEDAVKKFKEIFPDAVIESIESGFVRFLWWTYYEGYEYREAFVTCGYKKVDKKSKGTMDCWIINIKADNYLGFDYF